jgi:hypothetical protein
LTSYGHHGFIRAHLAIFRVLVTRETLIDERERERERTGNEKNENLMMYTSEDKLKEISKWHGHVL